MMTNSLRNKKFMEPMRQLSLEIGGPNIYFLLGWGQRKHTVVFVPNVFPNMFLLAPHFYPICFAQSSPLSHLYSWAKGKAPYPPIEPFIVGSLKSFGFLFLFCVGPIKMALFSPKKRKNLRSTPYI
jgi:hypothetical protein